MSAGRERTALARSTAQASGVYHRVAYGPSEANHLEIFADREGAHPTLLMFHGGWWQEGAIDDGGRYAATLAPLGATHVAVGYSLAPAATLPAIVAEASAAVTYLIEHAATLGCDVSRIVAAGHSAGAHLAATLVTELAPHQVRNAISGLLLIGGAFDLEPIAESYVNSLVGMSANEAKRLSPVNYVPQRNIPVLLRVGEHEPSEFHRQSELLREKWASHATVSLEIVPGRDHFDVLEELDTPGGSLLRDARALLQLSGT
jgi:arylformamidase